MTDAERVASFTHDPFLVWDGPNVTNRLAAFGQDGVELNESRMRMVLDHIVDAIITTNDRGVIESVNSAAETMFGLSSEQMIGNLFSTLLAEPYRQQYERYFAGYTQGSAAAALGVNTQIRGQRIPSGPFPLICTVTEMQFGNERKLIVIAHDASSQQDQNKRSA